MAVVEVADDEECSPGCHPIRDAPVEVQLRHCRMRVVGGDQVVLRLRRPAGEIGLDPAHPVTDSGDRSAVLRVVKCCIRNVGSGDIPALSCQPDGLCSGTAAGVECGSGFESADLLDQVGVRIA